MGIEDAQDLILDLEQAIKALGCAGCEVIRKSPGSLESASLWQLSVIKGSHDIDLIYIIHIELERKTDPTHPETRWLRANCLPLHMAVLIASSRCEFQCQVVISIYLHYHVVIKHSNGKSHTN